MKRDIRHLKYNTVTAEPSVRSIDTNEVRVTINEVEMKSWFEKFNEWILKKSAKEVTVESLTNETIDNKVKMYNNAISIK